jgi:4-azaleucine resistance transporter AzlC
MNNFSKLKQGIKSGLPIALGYFPIAIAFGALAAQAQLKWFEATLMSVIVYAGASQFVGVSMLLAGAGSIQIITTTFFLNLRHLLMSLSVNDQIRDFPQFWKNLLSFGITDETFALFTLGGNQQTNEEEISPPFLAGLMGTAYIGWVSGTAVGGLGAAFIPGEVTTAMTVGLYGLFIGLLVPPARKSLGYAWIALISMALNSALHLIINTGWAIVLSTVLAAGLGILFIKDTK